MLIVLSFIISVDSFFISCLTSGKLRSNIVLAVFSPLMHTLFCFLGFLLQYKIIPSYKNHSILLYLLIIALIFSGLYLFAIYNPRFESKDKKSCISPIKSAVIIILLLFCSFDAVVGGIVFVYWNIPIIKALIFIFLINLLMVLLPIIFKYLQQKTDRNKKSLATNFTN